MRRIRIAIFVMQLNAIGGGYRVIRNWCSLLNKKWFDIHIIIVSKNPNLILEDYKNISNISLTVINILELPWYSTIIVFKKLYNYLINEKIDILHTVFIQADILGAIAAKIAKVPVLISSVLGYLVNPLPQGSKILKIFLYKTGYSLVKNNFNKILTITNANLIELNQIFKVRKEKLQVNYCGIKLEQPSSIKTLRKEKSIYKIGVMAELIPPKGIDVFIKAIPEIINKCPSAKFVVAGDGPQLLILKELAIELSIKEKIEFLGWVSNSKEVIKKLDIFVFPSLLNYDGLPRVILEAWAVGTPVVATNVAVVPEIMRSNIDGFIVKPNSSNEIAMGVCELLSDRDKANKIAINAFKKVQDFDVIKEVETMENIYRELLNG